MCRWWYLGFQILREGAESGLLPLEEDFDAVIPIQNPTGQAVNFGKTIDEGTKAHSLDNAAHPDGTGIPHRTGSLVPTRNFRQLSSTLSVLRVSRYPTRPQGVRHFRRRIEWVP